MVDVVADRLADWLPESGRRIVSAPLPRGFAQ